MFRRLFAASTALCASLLAAAHAYAADPPYQPGFIELGLGATNIETTVGNGGLTAGVSKDGDLTMLSWPSPSYYDQMHYMTTNDPDAREQPRFGALEGMGSFAGLAFTRQGQSTTEVSFFRSDAWQRTAKFLAKDVGIIETDFDNADLGVTVRQIDLIPRDHDVFIRRFLVERDPSSPVQTASIIAYENLAPNLSKAPQVPLLDALIDHKNDFLAVWQPAEHAIMHFHPGDTGVFDSVGIVLNKPDRDFGPLGDLLKAAQPDPGQIDQLAGDLDANYAPGVYIAVSSMPEPVQFQIGEDTTDTCAMIDELADNIAKLKDRYPDKSLPAPPSVANAVRCGDYDPIEYPRTRNGWHYTAQDALADAKDGDLSGNRLAGGQVNAAIKFPLSFDAGSAQATLVYAFGKTAQKSQDELAWVRGQDIQSVQDDIAAADRAYLDSLWIPQEVTGKMREFIERAFLNLRVGTDRDTGAIVASVSRQPSYQLDWPRDGAFFNIALDIAGKHDLVTKRMGFYAGAIRDQAAPPTLLLNKPVPGWPDDPNNHNYPPDSWEMNYYADGIPGGNIRLEIDNTALLVWAFVYHVGHLDGQARETYINDNWPVIKRAANWLYGWRDPETGLNWPANEDDHAEFTQGLQGASTTYGALASAARLAKYLGKDALADKWLHRAGELKAATIQQMYVPGEGFYGEPGPTKLDAGSPYWLSWPTHMFAKDDPRFKPQLLAGLDKQVASVRGETPGGQYPTKVAISAALVLPDGPERDKALEIARRLATKIADPNTYTIGEHYSAVDSDGDGHYDNGWVNNVSTPHLWSMTLVYLTAVAYYHPEKFDAYDDVLPKVDVPEVAPPGVAGEDAGDAADVGDAGMDIGADAGDMAPPQDLVVPNDGCNCNTGGGVPGGGWMVIVFCLGVAFRGPLRRRR